MSDYRYPFITAKEPAEQLKQIESYLRQLVDKLNVSAQTAYTKAVIPGQSPSAAQAQQKQAEQTFDEIKSFIIKSADIVDSLYESVSRKMNGMYVAQSEFGQYTEETSSLLTQTSDRIETAVESVGSVTAANGEFKEAINREITSIKQSASDISVVVNTIINDGVTKLDTKTGYIFDAKGLRIQQAGQSIESLLNNAGLYVTRSSETMLKADSSGVEATDVKVNNYLIIGDHARFEDYNDGTDAKRTACFFISKEVKHGNT
jgi:hypothetical protein